MLLCILTEHPYGADMSIETEVVLEPETEEDIEVKEPNMWLVILHNDDKTTMEFVIMLLIQLFHKMPEEATQIMIDIHTKGRAVVGRYTHEVAEEKMNVTIKTARTYGHPLQATIEEDE